MGLSTATLAFFTLFMATSTSRMAKESRLDRQREYVTELIALVIDPIFELVKEH
jgi:hypothetical protein